ncbi:DUF3313 family protein [Woodsholea maritima]|uniref:DUF3313 family protein n=1 Tax=Woodsholea maritima TaxID=240237 RepID=UPI000378CECE|nr:DUF3313 family protein [Woodsholea maritima]
MRILAALVSTLLLVAPASAQRFEDEYKGQAHGPVTLGHVEVGQELAEKAEDYGQREIDRLVSEVEDDLTQHLSHANLFDAQSGWVLNVVLEDATPNRPTMEQLSATPGLSAQSFSLGGAELRAELIDPEGQVVAQYRYSWQSRDITDAQTATTWSDARRTISRFADQVAESLSEHSAS